MLGLDLIPSNKSMLIMQYIGDSFESHNSNVDQNRAKMTTCLYSIVVTRVTLVSVILRRLLNRKSILSKNIYQLLIILNLTHLHIQNIFHTKTKINKYMK